MDTPDVRSPLLGDPGLRACLRLTPAQILRTMRHLVAEADRAVAAVTQPDVPNTYAAIVTSLDDVHDRLTQAWNRVDHLHNVMNAPKWRRVMDKGNDLVVGHWTRYQQNTKLFRKYQALRNSTEYRRLSAAQRRVIELTLRDFQMAGADLPARSKRRLAVILRSLDRLSKEFTNRNLDAVNAIRIYTGRESDTPGIPASILLAARERAKKARRPGWIFTLQGSEPHTILQTARCQALRERVYRELIRNSSELGQKKFDTTPVMAKTLVYRQVMARILGYRTFADLSVRKKMAARPERATRFLRGIATVAKRQARVEYRQQRDFARRHLGLGSMRLWDEAFVSDQLRAKKFGYTQDQLRKYFPHNAVLRTLEDTVWRVFRVRLRRSQPFRPYHPRVFCYDVIDPRGGRLGSIVVDLFARPTKRAGAWVSDDTSRRVINGRMRTPVANCNCNFVPPGATGTSWLTHNDVHTLFHEFGHALNTILAMTTELRVGVTVGVEWDTIELPSQWMERFTREPWMLAAVHTNGARKLPLAAVRQIVATNAFLSGLYVLRQTRLGLFDLTLHAIRYPNRHTALRTWRAVARQYDVRALTPDNRFPNTFHHLFDGAYAAGYYSYLWAEVMAADAFAPLKRKPRSWRIHGLRFRREILSVGGSRPAADSFRALRGRPPRPDALMADYGLRSK